MIRHLLLLAAALLAAPLAAVAAPRALAWDDAVAARKLALVSGETLTELTGLHPSKRTAPLRVGKTGTLAIRALDRKPGPDGKPVDIACRIPEGVKYPLLVILPDDTHPTGVRPLIVDDNPAGFRWGTYRFLNSTPKELIVQMDQKAVRVPVGWKAVDVDLGGETRGIGARVALAESIEKPLYSAVWEYDPNVRTLCFLVPGTDARLSPVYFKAIPEDKNSALLDAGDETAQKN